MEIKYNGQVVDTIFHKDISDELFEKLRNEYYKNPTDNEICNEIASIICLNGTSMANIEKRYFRKLMAKTTVYTSKWSIEDIFNSKELLGIFVDKVEKNPKVFNSDSLIDNVETAIRLGGKGIAQKVANFPIKTMDGIFKRYNVNNKYYDMSCGWGARLVASLKNNVEYFGTDPNYLLIDKLNELKEFWQHHTHTHTNVKLYCQGSETFIPELENKIGLCFTSPPYFNLENYKIGNQSYKPGMEYKDWLNNFIKPTIQNCYKYLIDTGYLGINVKNFNGLTLEQDIKEICEQNGFVYIENYYVDNIKRIKSTNELMDNDENIMIFMKKGNEQNHKHWSEPEQLNLFDMEW